jgi:hypothetical protein
MIDGVPMPPAIVMGKISPRIVRHPGVAIVRIPHPASVVIRAPIYTDIIGNPDIAAVSPVVFPSAAVGQFIFILFIAVIEVAGGAVAGITDPIVSLPVPVVEIIFIRGIEIEGALFDLTVKHDNFLAFPDIPAIILPSHFSDTIVYVDFGPPSIVDIDPVQSPIQDKDTAIRGLDLNIPLIVEIFNFQVEAAAG